MKQDAEPPQTREVTKILERGATAWDRGDYALALACFQVVLDDHPDFPDVRNKAGLCLAMLGDLEGALEHLDAAVARNPRYAEAHLNRAIVLNELGRFDDAQASFTRAAQLERADEYPADLGNQLAIAHARVADLYVSCARPRQAVDEYLAALQVRPGFLDIRSRLAEAYLDLGRLDEARRELTSILDLNPGFTSARVRLGVVLDRAGDRAGALREWRRCADEAPGDTRVKAYLAAADPGGAQTGAQT